MADELSYDRYNVKADRIYRVNSDFKVNGSLFEDRETPGPMATDILKDYPGIENAARIKNNGNILVRKGNQTLIEPDSFFADDALFKVFTLPMIAKRADLIYSNLLP